MDPAPSKVLVPVRYAAWLSGALGERLTEEFRDAVQPADVVRLPRGFLVQADEAPGVLLESVHRAVAEMEQGVARAYPVFHQEMGPLWTGTLQSVFPAVERARGPAARHAAPQATDPSPAPRVEDAVA